MNADGNPRWGLEYLTGRTPARGYSQAEWDRLRIDAQATMRACLYSDMRYIWDADPAPLIDGQAEATLEEYADRLYQWRRDYEMSLASQGSPYAAVEVTTLCAIAMRDTGPHASDILRIDLLEHGRVTRENVDPRSLTWTE